LAALDISVVLIGLSVAQSLVVYVAITACPSTEPEISVGFIGLSVTQSLVRDLRFRGRASSYNYIYN
jgi:hypothetical protein